MLINMHCHSNIDAEIQGQAVAVNSLFSFFFFFFFFLGGGGQTRSQERKTKTARVYSTVSTVMLFKVVTAESQTLRQKANIQWTPATPGPWRGTADAEVKIPSAENQELSKPSFKSAVGKKIALSASLALLQIIPPHFCLPVSFYFIICFRVLFKNKASAVCHKQWNVIFYLYDNDDLCYASVADWAQSTS